MAISASLISNMTDDFGPRPRRRPDHRDAPAWIDGKAASLDEAAARAAQLLARSSQPLFAGMGADIDGVRAAVSLAERLGGVIDHTHTRTACCATSIVFAKAAS